MDEIPQIVTCPKCHIAIRPTDYFCFNCGTNLHPKPLSTSIPTQLLIYTGSIFLAPMGLIWGWRYIRQPETKSKIVGSIAITLTIITLIIATILIKNFMNMINSQVYKQLETIQGF